MSAKSQGSRIYKAPLSTAWVALAAGAYPAGAWVEVTRGTEADTKPHEVEKYDNSCLNDSAPDPAIELKPSGLSFTREKDALSPTLRAACDGTTKYEFAEVFVDGTAETCTGYLTCTSAGKATKGFANRVSESYEVVATTKSVHRVVAA